MDVSARVLTLPIGRSPLSLRALLAHANLTKTQRIVAESAMLTLAFGDDLVVSVHGAAAVERALGALDLLGLTMVSRRIDSYGVHVIACSGARSIVFDAYFDDGRFMDLFVRVEFERSRRDFVDAVGDASASIESMIGVMLR
jgi:hypothetical protein